MKTQNEILKTLLSQIKIRQQLIDDKSVSDADGLAREIGRLEVACHILDPEQLEFMQP